MTAAQTRILGEISGLLRSIADSLPPGEDITMETKFIDDLEMDSLQLANLTGRIAARYGSKADLVSLYGGREGGPFHGLRVGELVDHLAGVVDDGEAAAVPGRLGAESDGTGQDEDAARRLGRLAPVADRHRPGNDNAAVLSEHAPGTARSLVRLAEGEVEAFTAGDGPPLILIHPIDAGAGVFARQFAALAGEYRLICLHNPGVGATTWEADLTLSGLARLCRTALAALSVPPPFHVMGASFGGLVAQEFALLHPAECASLVLAGSSYQASTRGEVRPLPAILQEEFGRIREGGGDQTMQGDRSELEKLLLRCESMDSRIGLRYVDALVTRPTLFTRLPEITAPTLVLRGRHDTLIPAKDAHLLYGAIPDAQFAELADAGHFPFLTHPAQFNGLLEPFLAAHAGKGRRASGTTVRQPAEAARGIATAGMPETAPPPDPCSIVINSGRCGSTLLSRLIAEEPETLSASESLGPIRDRLRRQTGEITGASYWASMSDRGKGLHLMQSLGITGQQFCYPDGGRYAGEVTSIPAILHVTLPFLSADPDGLFDQLAERVPHFPRQPVLQHHKMMLNLMTNLTGRRRWVERSGASSSVASSLLCAFPEAKIVYLTRNIADTARSMSRHPAFQLGQVREWFRVQYGADPWTPDGQNALPDAAEVPEELRRLMPGRITEEALTDVMTRDISRFEALTSHLHGSAEQALADMQPRHLHRLRYEDLVARPLDELTKLGEFLGFADPSWWAARTANQVSRSPRTRPTQPA